MIDKSVQCSQNGVDITGEIVRVFEGISASIDKTSGLVGEISAASKEQAQGIEQINTAVAHIDQVTQSNAATAEQSASASEELNVESGQMQTIVENLVGLVGGVSKTENVTETIEDAENITV